MVHRLSCSAARGIFPDQGLNPWYPALAGGFFTTGPLGKPPFDFNSYSTGASHIAQLIKHLSAMRVDLGSIPGLGRSPGEGNGNPLQYSGLENPKDGGAWQTTVHGIARVGHELALSFFLPSFFIFYYGHRCSAHTPSLHALSHP